MSDTYYDGAYSGAEIDAAVAAAFAADYAVSTAFAPYAPTNCELYEMILAMQS